MLPGGGTALCRSLGNPVFREKVEEGFSIEFGIVQFERLMRRSFEDYELGVRIDAMKDRLERRPIARDGRPTR